MSHIQPDPNNPRHALEHYDNEHPLVVSLRHFGLMEPLLVCQAEEGHCRIIDGHRRYQAARFLLMPAVPCLVHPPLSEADVQTMRFLLHDTHRPWRKAEREAVEKRLHFTRHSHLITRSHKPVTGSTDVYTAF